RSQRWSGSDELLRHLDASDEPLDRAAAAWAAAFAGDAPTVVRSLEDADPKVRREGLRSFARMKGEVAGSEDSIIACLRDVDVEVRREALVQAIRRGPRHAWRRTAC